MSCLILFAGFLPCHCLSQLSGAMKLCLGLTRIILMGQRQLPGSSIILLIRFIWIIISQHLSVRHISRVVQSLVLGVTCHFLQWMEGLLSRGPTLSSLKETNYFRSFFPCNFGKTPPLILWHYTIWLVGKDVDLTQGVSFTNGTTRSSFH